ncbi:hypothetical protein [Algibacter sp.]|uniref:hypothetical protein n=1 Tax=Algibacter sp. TaxID=1872428 RepID=UPI003C76D9D5
MNTKFFSIVLTCFIATTVFAQSNINNYKYVIVPNKFDFLKEDNQYQINALTEFLFNKYGFEALMEGSDYPEDLSQNRCLALISDVIEDSGMLKTKLKVELKDCNNKLVFTSSMGESREKEFSTAFNLALRDAFKSIEALNYKYEPSINSIGTASQPQVKTEATEEIQQLKKEIQVLKQEKQAEVAVVEQAKPEVPKVVVKEVIPVAQKQDNQVAVIEGVSNVLYAQAIDNGFQLVDSSPKVVYRIKNSNLKDVYLVEGKSAIIYKKGDDWVVEYYSGDTLVQEALNIKF